MKKEVYLPLLYAKARDIVSAGYATGTYARSMFGKPVGLHSATASEHDLASSLWLASESICQDRREDCFSVAWRTLRKALAWEKKDAELCHWLDAKSQDFVLSLLSHLAQNGAAAYKAPRAQRVDRRILEYA